MDLKNHPVKEASSYFEDMNKSFDEKTLSYSENFMICFHEYAGLALVFGSTLCVFPVLTFKLDFYLPSYIQFAYISTIFNLGDTLSRFIYFPFPIDNKIVVDCLVLVKVSLVYFMYLSVNSHSGLLTSHITRFMIVFLLSFLNGYLCMAYIDSATQKFISIYDRNRTGYLINTSIQIGLTIGALLSAFW